MAELIVALDCPDPRGLMLDLVDRTPVRWFKVGPQVMTSGDWPYLVRRAGYNRETYGANLFLDIKIADSETEGTVKAAVVSFAQHGVAALSVRGHLTTQAAKSAAAGYPIKIWQHLNPSDRPVRVLGTVCKAADGYIVPSSALGMLDRSELVGKDIVTVGVRVGGDPADGHHLPDPDVICNSATYAVVGRPIHGAHDPIAAARRYVTALS